MIINKLDKIVMIGPVFPFKSGLAHYTGEMCRALRIKYDVTMVSYLLQYPGFLYKKEQKDESNDSHKVEDTKYWIHSANPFNWIKSAQKIKKENPDLIIIQWLHPYFAPCFYFMAKLMKNCKILFVCHNIFPHERFRFDKILTKMTLRQGNLFIVQASTIAEELKTIIPNAVYKLTPHPTYHVYKIENLSKENAKTKLKLRKEQKVILFFGLVREYKGLKYLIQALPKVIEKYPEVKLLIAGDFVSDKEEYYDLIHARNVDKYIDIYEGHIPDKEVEKFFAACDVTVLPYESATQSGIIQMAYGFEKPVIVTNVGGLPEAVTDGHTGYVVEAKNPDKLAEVIIKFYEQNKENVFSENIRKESERFSWDKMIQTIEELYSNYIFS